MEHKLEQLENGLTVIAVATPIFRSIQIQIYLKGGANIETKENNGISHFVEHMTLQGSRNFPDKDVFDENFEYLGGDYNGYTSSNKVVFRINLPDTHLMFGLDYFADVTENALFPTNELETERSAIIDEIHNHNTDAYKKFNDFWTKNRYVEGYKPLVLPGTKSGVKKMSKSALIEWYHYLMSPDNMTISIVGNIDPEVAVQMVKDRFGSRSRHPKSITEDSYSICKASSATIKTQVDKNAKKTIGTISFPSYSIFNDDYKTRQTAKILESVIVNYRSSILYKKLRKELGLIYSIYGDQFFGERYPGIFEIAFTTSDDLVEQVYTIVLEELEKLRSNGISQELLKLGIDSGNNALKMGYSSLSQVEGWYAASVFWFKEVREIEDAIAIRESIDLEYANSILQQMLDKKSMSIISRVNEQKTKIKLEKKLNSIV